MTEQVAQAPQTLAAPQQPAPTPSVQDRLKAFLSAPRATGSDDSDSGTPRESEEEIPPVRGGQEQTKEPPKAPKAAQPQAEAVDEVPDGEESEAEPDVDLTSVQELAERTGLTLDRIMDLQIPTKIDGQEGKTTIREALKNFQLDGHLSNKLKAHAEERKAFEAEALRTQQAYQQKLQQADAGLQVMQRLLQGEFASINWQELQQTDPATFNQHYVSFQHRQAMLDQIAKQLGDERQALAQQTQEKQSKWLQEQKTLLETKVPEWADSKVRTAEIKEMSELFSKAYGVGEQDLNALTDHRDFLVARDAMRWLKLQASKPAVVNKVRQAPKLLKPGTSQSQATQRQIAVTNARDQLRKSGGKDRRALANVIKGLGVV